MPIRPTLLAEIQQALGSATIPSLTSAAAVSDIYEAYLFSLVLQAARTEGADVTLTCINGGAPSTFVFRTSPGYLNSRHRNYGYAVIEFPGCPALEAHLGVRVSGHSAVLHECDISVLMQTEAVVCRSRNELVAPRSHKVVIAVEAKYYTTDLALHLGRGFLGLVRDLSAQNAFFVINREARSIERLLAHKKQQWEHKIVPNEPVSVNRLTNALQKAFHNFQAKYGV
jgi:hypothetical protein